jgi:hypothetical protein
MSHHLLDVLVMILLGEGDKIRHRVEVHLHDDVSIATIPLGPIGLRVVIGMNPHLVEGMCLPVDEMIAHPLVVDLPHLDVAILLDDQDGIALPLAGRQIVRIQRIAVGVQVSILEIRAEVDSQ